MLRDPGGHAGIRTLDLFELFLEDVNLSPGALPSGLEFILNLGEAVLGITLNLLTAPKPLNRGGHQSHSLER